MLNGVQINIHILDGMGHLTRLLIGNTKIVPSTAEEIINSKNNTIYLIYNE